MLNNFHNYTEQLVYNHAVPAISIAVWSNGEFLETASGVLNTQTGVEATTDSIFQIGSITKVFTSSLIMLLVEQGRLDLEAPIKSYLPDLNLADPIAAKTITARQLLNHTSGMLGDYFPDDHHEDGPHIARYVDRCSLLPQLTRPGDSFSYCNAGYAIAGRLIEVILGLSWHQAMQELIFRPLGMDHAITRPSEVIRFRAAIGHVVDSSNAIQWRPTSGKYLCQGQAAAGLTTSMTASDLISFARAHLEDGRNSQGHPWLTKPSLKQMRTASVDVPIYSSDSLTAMGMGWFIVTPRSGPRYLQHAGLTNGQSALLRLFPDQQACFAILLNCNNPDVMQKISARLSAEIVGEQWICSNDSTYVEVDADILACYQGRYQCGLGEVQVALVNKYLHAQVLNHVDEEAPKQGMLSALTEESFDLLDKNGVVLTQLRFINKDRGGIPQQLFSGMRCYQRSLQ